MYISPIKPVSSSCPQSVGTHSFSRSGTLVGGSLFCHWRGYAMLAKGTSATELPIVIPSTQRGIPNRLGMILPQTAVITGMGMRLLNDVYLGGAGNLEHSLHFCIVNPNGSRFTKANTLTGASIIKTPDPFGNLNSDGSAIVKETKVTEYRTISGGNLAIAGTNPFSLDPLNHTLKVIGRTSTDPELPSALTAHPESDIKILVYVSFYCELTQPNSQGFLEFPSDDSYFESAPAN
jgi:hypothetical protein